MPCAAFPPSIRSKKKSSSEEISQVTYQEAGGYPRKQGTMFGRLKRRASKGGKNSDAEDAAPDLGDNVVPASESREFPEGPARGWARGQDSEQARPEERRQPAEAERRDGLWAEHAMSSRSEFNSRAHGLREVQNLRVVYESFGTSPLEMRVRKLDFVPMPRGATDVVIRVKASSVSYKDCIIRRGMWHEATDLPATPGFDCVGVVENMGDDVKRAGIFKEGDPVAALLRTGGNARYVTVPVYQVASVPGGIDSSQAICVLSSYMTAYQALHRARPRFELDTLEGKKVLATGGVGPVGMAIIELALRAGAREVYTTADARFHNKLIGMGATPLPLTVKEWLPRVRGRMDCVVDGLCQDNYASPHAALNKNGVLVCIGKNSVIAKETPGWFGQPMSVKWADAKSRYLMKNTVSYDIWDSFQQRPKEFEHDLQYLMSLLQQGKIKPKVVERISLSEVPKAQLRLERGELAGGVVVVKPWK